MSSVVAFLSTPSTTYSDSPDVERVLCLCCSMAFLSPTFLLSLTHSASCLGGRKSTRKEEEEGSNENKLFLFHSLNPPVSPFDLPSCTNSRIGNFFLPNTGLLQLLYKNIKGTQAESVYILSHVFLQCLSHLSGIQCPFGPWNSSAADTLNSLSCPLHWSLVGKQTGLSVSCRDRRRQKTQITHIALVKSIYTGFFYESSTCVNAQTLALTLVKK